VSVLITGVGGLIGGWLCEDLLRRGRQVHGWDIAEPVTVPVGGGDAFFFSTVDLLDRDALPGHLQRAAPDMIFHLAAQSLPSASWEKPAMTCDVNITGTLNLFDALRKIEINPVVVTACSSGEYAVSRDGRPIREDDAMDPGSPYAVSKLVVDHLVRVYAARYALRLIAVRPFFLVGPRKRGDVCSDFARGIVAVERGTADVLRVGNLDAVRDIMDVRDGVRAFTTVAERGAPGTAYNICTGRGISIAHLLDLFIKQARVSVHVEPDPARMRPIDEPVKVGDPARLQALGWSADTALEDTAADILAYWRAKDNKKTDP
jgi:GDP-4-dehydro-6-deoxy-D-mannose reductase